MSNRHKKIDFIDNNLVDIVIPVYGNYDFVRKNLEFLRIAFPKTKYKIYLADDESPEYEKEGRAFWPKLRQDFPEIADLVIHRKNKGYSYSVNELVRLGRSKHILVLNSDLLLLDSAGEYLLEYLKNDVEVGITFPKLLFFPNQNDPRRPAGKIQHAGIAFDINRNPFHIHLGWDADHPFVNSIKDFNACTGACFMIKREVWHAVGGYDQVYGRGTYEDIDLCFKIRSMKMSVRYIPLSTGYHFTNGSYEKYKVGFPINENRAIWLKKFGQNIPFDEWALTGC